MHTFTNSLLGADLFAILHCMQSEVDFRNGTLLVNSTDRVLHRSVIWPLWRVWSTLSRHFATVYQLCLGNCWGPVDAERRCGVRVRGCQRALGAMRRL
jgi:hypothetical protein